MRDDELTELQQNLHRDDGLDHVRTSAVDLGRWLVDHLGDEQAATAQAQRTQHKSDWDACWATRARIKEDLARRLETADDAALRAAALCVQDMRCQAISRMRTFSTVSRAVRLRRPAVRRAVAGRAAALRPVAASTARQTQLRLNTLNHRLRQP
jgi:hypothetical protein